MLITGLELGFCTQDHSCHLTNAGQSLVSKSSDQRAALLLDGVMKPNRRYATAPKELVTRLDTWVCFIDQHFDFEAGFTGNEEQRKQADREYFAIAQGLRDARITNIHFDMWWQEN